jgi:hypothetical protein
VARAEVCKPTAILLFPPSSIGELTTRHADVFLIRDACQDVLNSIKSIAPLPCQDIPLASASDDITFQAAGCPTALRTRAVAGCPWWPSATGLRFTVQPMLYPALPATQTASVVQQPEFLPANPQVPGSIPGATFSE